MYTRFNSHLHRYRRLNTFNEKVETRDMKIIINSIGSVGDVNPFLSVGAALLERGNDVLMLSSGALKDRIQHSGIPYQEVLTEKQYDRWRNLPTDTNEGLEDIKAFSYMSLPSALPTANIILDNCHNGCICIGMPLQSIGINFAKIKAPNQVITLEAMLAPRNWRISEAGINTFNKAFSPYLHQISQLLAIASPTTDWFTWLKQFDQKLAFFPNWFNVHNNHLLTSPHSSDFVFYEDDDNQPLPSELIHFIEAGSPPIAFTFGSYVSERQDLFEIVAQVCKMLNVRGVLLTKYPEQIPSPIPKNLFHADYVSLRYLLPKMRAFVHHGGIGTIAQALRAGIAQVACPMAYDQFDNAQSLHQLQVSQTVEMNAMTVESLAIALREVLDNQHYNDNAKAIAKHRFTAHGTELLCDQIERYIGMKC